MTKIIIIVRPAAGKSGAFDAHVNGRYLCTSSSPFIAACRILAAQGADPDATAVMRHDGDSSDALRGRLGAVADVEPTGKGTGFRRHGAVGAAAHIRSNGLAHAVHQPGSDKSLHQRGAP